MARKPAERRPANLSEDRKRAAIDRLLKRIIELKQLDVRSISGEDDPKVTEVEARIRATLASIYGEDTHEFQRLIPAANLDLTAYSVSLVDGPNTFIGEIREGIERGRNGAVSLLQGEVDSLNEELQDKGQLQEPTVARNREAPSSDVFIVHGHDSGAKTEVQLFIRRAGLNPVVLHEQPNVGRTIIEKFESHGGAAGFAVVLLTPDDIGGPDKDSLQPRARQNVIGEMFWFAGRLGRARVCALKKGEVEVPSDFGGVGYTDMDDRGAWKLELLKELRAAGYKVNFEEALA
jgi:predicted nucleotide-binding protein